MKIARSIAVELLKLKRKRLLILVGGSILFSIIVAYLPSISTGRFDWHELLSANLFILAEILFLMFSYVTGVIFASEYENGTIETVLSTPVSISEIVFGKVAAIVAFALVTVFGAIIFTLCAGVAFRIGRLPSELFGRYCRALAIIVLIQLCYIPLYILASVSMKKTIYPSVFGMLMIAVMMVFSVADYATYIPPCFPVLIQFEILGGNAYTGEFLHAQDLAVLKPAIGISLMVVIAVLPIPFCRRFLRRY
jgi:ABC-type transport system involved in multi-copper enzyme maturation permease subunit